MKIALQINKKKYIRHTHTEATKFKTKQKLTKNKIALRRLY